MRRFAVVSVLLALLAAGCSGGHRASPSPTPAATAATTPAGPASCPVEAELCRFSEAIERIQQGGTLAASFGKNNQAAIKAALAADTILNAAGPGARITTIGCPLAGNAPDCSKRFALTLSSLPKGLEQQDSRGLAVLFFERSATGVGASQLVAEYEPPGGREIVVNGGERAFCDGVSGQPGCVDYRFLPYSTGAPEPGAPATAGKLPPPRQVSGATTREMTLGAPYAIKPGELWYFNYLCDACGPGPFPNLYRAYRAADGSLVVDDLKAHIAGLGLGTVVSFLADWRNGDAWMASCQGDCGPQEGGGSMPGFEETVYRSKDGGITWTKDGSLPAQTTFLGIAGGLIASTWADDHQSNRYWYYPEGNDLASPQRVTETVYPVVLNGLTVVWASNTGNYYDGAGTKLFGPLFSEQYRMSIVSADPQYQHTYVTWSEADFSKPTSWLQQPWYSYLGHIDRAGQMKDLYALPGDTLWISGEFPRQGDGALALFGRFRFGTSRDYVAGVSFGGVLDLQTAQVHRFTELDAARPPGSFAWMQDLVALSQESPTGGQLYWLRATGAGDCVNVREAPSLSSRVLTCLADDVLVGNRGQRQTADGLDWILVRTPGNQSGWMSVQYLR
jgi:hypothetical protein